MALFVVEMMVSLGSTLRPSAGLVRDTKRAYVAIDDLRSQLDDVMYRDFPALPVPAHIYYSLPEDRRPYTRGQAGAE